RTEASYGPTWGGVFNPVLGGCFLLGSVELYWMRSTPMARALAFAFFIFLLPGFLAADHVEMFRIIPVMPILLVIAAFGIQRLLMAVPGQRRVLVLAVLIGASFLTDFYHLMGPPGLGAASATGMRQNIGDESFEAYKILKDVEAQRGPGLVFTEFLPLSRGHNLRVAVYPFNAADNPRVDPGPVDWAAVIVNAHYESFLGKRFPGSQWHRIEIGNREDGGLAVGILPLNPGNRAAVQKWLRAHDFIHQLGVQSENMMNNPLFYRSVVQRLTEGYPLMAGDPFLESIYGEWVAQYHYTHGMDGNISALQRAIAKGYPAANLYYKLGNFYYWNHDPPKAKQAYLMAAQCRPNYTNAGEVLTTLWGKPGKK
ncbi:MAG TPA: hypothetical protein VJ873_01590, partial [bacterium]|nr:hypothetical protein [bacterium]